MKEKVSGFWMEGKRWIPTFVGMTETSNEIAALSSKAHDNRRIDINHIYLQMGKMCKVCGKIPS